MSKIKFLINLKKEKKLRIVEPSEELKEAEKEITKFINKRKD